MWYKKNKESNPKRAEFNMQKGHNTSIINREKENSILSPCRSNKAPGRM